jgi:SAM-dependent methyltransferase
MMNEDRPGYWDEFGAGPLQNGPPEPGLWRRHADAVNAALLRRWLPAGPIRRALKTDLFDEAFGEGLVPLLAERAEHVVGTDLAPHVRRAASRRYPRLEAVAADVRSLPFKDASFDLIVSNSTLDHFETQADIRAALSELARILRPGGGLILTLDNPANPAVWLRNALPQGWLRRLRLIPYPVGATCGARRLDAAVRAAGLEVRETTAILHCPRVLAVAAAGWLDRRPGRTGEAFLRPLLAFERLERWPTRFHTGHFVAVRAGKPGTQRR